MKKLLNGKAWVYGDNVDTDVIIPARHLSTIIPEELAKYCMEDIDKSFAKEVQAGDIMVAGQNFGCGSSREHAPIAIVGAKIDCVIAASFARIFYRNAVNVGLPILECPEAVKEIKKGDEIAVDIDTGIITNKSSGKSYQAQPFPPFLQDLISSGGLVPYVQKLLKEKK